MNAQEKQLSLETLMRRKMLVEALLDQPLSNSDRSDYQQVLARLTTEIETIESLVPVF